MTEKVSTFAARLREGLSLRSMTQAELARRTGLDRSSISRYLKNEYKGNQDAVYKISQTLAVSEAWLMGYDVPMEPQKQAAPQPTPIPPGFQPMPEMATVPIVGRIACGTPILAEQNIEGSACVPARWRATFSLVCKGDSMEPKIHDGDLVAIRKQPEVENGEIAAVRIGEEATLKHVYKREGYLELRPENPRYDSIILIGQEMENATIEGKAVGLCRDV